MWLNMNLVKIFESQCCGNCWPFAGGASPSAWASLSLPRSWDVVGFLLTQAGALPTTSTTTMGLLGLGPPLVVHFCSSAATSALRSINARSRKQGSIGDDDFSDVPVQNAPCFYASTVHASQEQALPLDVRCLT